MSLDQELPSPPEIDEVSPGFDRLDRYVAALEELTRVLRHRNRRLWQAVGVITVLALMTTAFSAIGWHSAGRSAQIAAKAGRENHRLLTEAEPLISPAARAAADAASQATSRYYITYLNGLCVGENALARSVNPICIPPPPPSR